MIADPVVVASKRVLDLENDATRPCGRTWVRLHARRRTSMAKANGVPDLVTPDVITFRSCVDLVRGVRVCLPQELLGLAPACVIGIVTLDRGVRRALCPGESVHGAVCLVDLKISPAREDVDFAVRAIDSPPSLN